MSKRYYIRKTADNDLDEIYVYSLEHFGHAQTISYLKNIIENFQNLADNYKLGRDYSFIREDLYAFTIQSHIIYYKPVKDGIDIYRVLHKSRDYKSHL